MIWTDNAMLAQQSVIGSMLIDERCVPVVFQRLRPEDFTEPRCRHICEGIYRLFLESKPIDAITVTGAIRDGTGYIPFLTEVAELTPSAANVEAYTEQVLEAARMYRFRELCEKGLACPDTAEAEELQRKMAAVLSSIDRMPRMTAVERMTDFHQRVSAPEKPEYLPWGIPVADRATYTELGDMILLGGYASSGKTLLSIAMAQAQARAGYRVGYYSLETSPEKMTDRQISALSGVPLERIKTRNLTETDWGRLVQAEVAASEHCPFDIIQASRATVDDIITDAIGHRYQIIYVDYVQLIRISGKRELTDYARVTAVSQRLKEFAQSTHTAVVALAQLSRPPKDGKSQNAMTPPNMYSFKESGQLEQDADVAFLVWLSDPNDNGSNRMFKIGKNKEGRRPAAVKLVFHGDTQTMVSGGKLRGSETAQ